jgi:aminopeptidase N
MSKQAIHARSLLPCQDTPGIKITYSANVIAPQGLTALMSAVKTGHDKGTNKFSFKQATSMPSYLIAIAVGNLQGISVGPRTTVWSEPEVVKEAAWEFEDTESFIKVGETLLSPYNWGVYDLLVLPSSFPYGGMFLNNQRNGKSLFDFCHSNIACWGPLISRCSRARDSSQLDGKSCHY